MPWQYSQSIGQLTHGTGAVVGRGYSGRGAGQNNPQMQNPVGMGPIPTRSYSIGAPFHHRHAGNCTMRLTPNASTVLGQHVPVIGRRVRTFECHWNPKAVV
ncbi:hypothetical protein FEQ05_01558 [Burkholderia pseudomultivorans]|uniref:Uncharacterized protein n=1 Tax=Burkholderia pseudomultivorans TaxID=1207504 RepID=A0A6P2QZD5_9BURK|nr:hypothetical protein [Burkholderia pseudomultivorans]MDR8732771.1 hypothetical protein [Burkholderia pseudomultivorans]MDR8739637.1 hypothetical protein [Burkholderia pseudomultivorans]MDR8752645.1 hypothetical protein [Burkholderia pseudomultivorans]MDR8775743.1 hypothetical protein [Burkholderia pseudomultivorans]